MKNKNKKYRGLTLVETLIYLAILSMVITFIVPTLYSLELLRSRMIKSENLIADYVFIEINIRDLLKKSHQIISPEFGGNSAELKIRRSGGPTVTIRGDEDNNLVYIDGEYSQILNNPHFVLKNFNLHRLGDEDYSENFETIKYRYDTDFIFGTSSVGIFVNQ